MSSGVPNLYERVDQAVFVLLVEAYPAAWSREEVIRELADDPSEFAARDAVSNSLRDLVGYGLLHRNGELYVPTRAAIHAVRLCE